MMLDFIDQGFLPADFLCRPEDWEYKYKRMLRHWKMYRVRIAHPRVSCLSILPSLYDRMKPYPQLFFF